MVLPDESPAVVVTFICQQLHCVRDRKTNKIKTGSEVRRPALPCLRVPSLCSSWSMRSALDHDCGAQTPEIRFRSILHCSTRGLTLTLCFCFATQATIRNVFYRWTLRRTYDSEEFDWKLATFEMHQIAELTV